MNARALPLSPTHPADPTVLETEMPAAAATQAASALLQGLQLAPVEHSECIDGQYVHRLLLPRCAANPCSIDVLCVGADALQARSGVLHAAIAHWAHASIARTLPFALMKVADYIRRPDVELAFHELVPMLATQSERRMATVQFHRMGRPDTLEVPLGLINAGHLRQQLEAGVPLALRDDVDYPAWAAQAADIVSVAGASRDEALLKALLAAQERLHAAQFAIDTLTPRQAGQVRYIADSDMPAPLRGLLETVSAQSGARVHLLSMAGPCETPALLAYADHAEPDRRWLAFGAGFSLEHAAHRALRDLLRQQRSAVYAAVERGTLAATIAPPIAKFQPALERLHALLGTGHCMPATFSSTMPTATTLAGRLQTLCLQMEDAGLVPWYVAHELPDNPDAVHCVQVLLTPFDTRHLLLQGFPPLERRQRSGEASNA